MSKLLIYVNLGNVTLDVLRSHSHRKDNYVVWIK